MEYNNPFINKLEDNAKILGKGAYGCVIPKVIKCNNDNREIIDKGTTQVSKLLLNKNDFEKEVKNTLFINKNDKGNTSIIIDDTCILDENNILDILHKNNIESKFLHNCGISFGNKKVYQIIYNKRGISLREVIDKRLLSITNIIKLFYNLYKGILLFNKLNFVHFDIKKDNIIYIENDRKFVFIDFGLSSTYNDFLFKKTLQEYGSSPRYYYPPEFIAFSLWFKKNDDSYENNFRSFKYLYEYELIILSDNNNIIKKIILYNHYNDYNNYENELKRLFNVYNSSDDPYKVLSKTLNKIDIYSLSITLYRTIEKYNKKNSNINNFYKYILFPALHINPHKRISINKILYNYKKFI